MRIQALIALTVVALADARRGAPAPEPSKAFSRHPHPTYGWGFQMESPAKQEKDEKAMKEVKNGTSMLD